MLAPSRGTAHEFPRSRSSVLRSGGRALCRIARAAAHASIPNSLPIGKSMRQPGFRLRASILVSAEPTVGLRHRGADEGWGSRRVGRSASRIFPARRRSDAKEAMVAGMGAAERSAPGSHQLGILLASHRRSLDSPRHPPDAPAGGSGDPTTRSGAPAPLNSGRANTRRRSPPAPASGSRCPPGSLHTSRLTSH